MMFIAELHFVKKCNSTAEVETSACKEKGLKRRKKSQAASFSEGKRASHQRISRNV